MWLDEARVLHGKGNAKTWFNLFSEVDEDGSGFITYDELHRVVRVKLRKSKTEMPDMPVKALWCSLDVNDSNAIEKDEMAPFFKRGGDWGSLKAGGGTSGAGASGASGEGEKPAPMKRANTTAVSKAPPPTKRGGSSVNSTIGSARDLVSSIERHGMARPLDCQPTSEMREELEEAGVSLPTEAEMDDLSKKLNVWLDEARVLHGKGNAKTWYNLFSEVDEDGSGFITYDELHRVMRTKLHKNKTEMPDKQIKALWCSLDINDSNAIDKDEMAAFFKRGGDWGSLKAGGGTSSVRVTGAGGQGEKPAPMKRANTTAVSKPPPPIKKGSTTSTIGSARDLVSSIERHGMARALDCQPTKEMREELELMDVSFPNEAEMDDLSKKLNTWLDEVRVLHSKGYAKTWFNLYSEVDEDGSGFITYDELHRTLRTKLHKSKTEIPDKLIKALWCNLDVNNSNSVEKDEMAAFLKRGGNWGGLKRSGVTPGVTPRPVVKAQPTRAAHPSGSQSAPQSPRDLPPGHPDALSPDLLLPSLSARPTVPGSTFASMEGGEGYYTADMRYVRRTCLELTASGNHAASLQVVEALMDIAQTEERLIGERKIRLAGGIRLCNELALSCMQPDKLKLGPAHDYLASAASRMTSESAMALRAVTLNSLGIYFMRSEQPQVALRCFDCVRQIGGGGAKDDVNLHALLNTTTVLSELGRDAESLRAAEAAVRIVERGHTMDPSLESAAFHNLAVASQRVGAGQIAIKSFRAALRNSRRQRTSERCTTAAGAARMRQGSPDKKVARHMQLSYESAVNRLPSAPVSPRHQPKEATGALSDWVESWFAASGVGDTIGMGSSLSPREGGGRDPLASVSFAGSDDDLKQELSADGDELLKMSMTGFRAFQPRAGAGGGVGKKRHARPAIERAMGGPAPTTLVLLPLDSPARPRAVSPRIRLSPVKPRPQGPGQKYGTFGPPPPRADALASGHGKGGHGKGGASASRGTAVLMPSKPSPRAVDPAAEPTRGGPRHRMLEKQATEVPAAAEPSQENPAAADEAEESGGAVEQGAAEVVDDESDAQAQAAAATKMQAMQRGKKARADVKARSAAGEEAAAQPAE